MKLFQFITLGLVMAFPALATQERGPLPIGPFYPTHDFTGLDKAEPQARLAGISDNPSPASGPIAPAGTQPVGALSGRVIYTSAGHGWFWNGSAWALGRPVLNTMNEDYGNVDQMTLFVYYCFNAGATVVPMRPVGQQTNEVVLDNTSPSVAWWGNWMDSTSPVYYGAPGAVPYRYTALSTNETARATYTPTIPQAGFYPVYTWVLSSWNRVSQLYRINHTGGQSQVRVPHDMVGNGWVYLGTYYFNAGSNSAAGAVIIGNATDRVLPDTVVVADAIRFGNGMGDVDRGGGVSGYPREEECSRYWVQRSLGQGQSSTIYDNPALGDDSDNVGAPIRMAAEMNREATGSMYKRLYVGFHSNAGGGRGVLGLYNDPNLSTNVAKNSNTPNQYRLAQLLGTEVNGDLCGITVPPLELAWYNRSATTYARSDYAFGEINNNTITNEFDASMVEVGFHDDASDARLLRDSKARNWVARACCQAVVRYMNQFEAVPLNFLPEPPFNLKAMAATNGVVLSWFAPLSQGGSGSATGYVAYVSRDGYGFGSPVGVPGLGTTSLTITNLEAGTDYYFRVAAVNAGGESLPSETVGCRRASNPLSSRILVVNGFARFDRTLNLRQTPSPWNYKPPGHDANSGTMERVLPARVNAFNYVVPHGKAIAAAGIMGFDSCQLQAATNGQVNLRNYDIVIWAAGNQSTAEGTFNSAAQARVTSYLASGGNLFVSGSEIAWDLDRASGPTAADRDFLHRQLHAALNGDANDDSGVFLFTPSIGSLFAGNAAGSFDDGSSGIYWVGYPDALSPVGQGAAATLTYPGFAGGNAAVTYDGSGGGGKVVYFGFPFETISSEIARKAYMADTLTFLSRVVRFGEISLTANNQPRLRMTAEPGFTYAVQTSADLLIWTTVTNLPSGAGEFEWVDGSPGSSRRFYRAVLAL